MTPSSVWCLRRLLGALLIASCVLSATGCGVKLLYNNADRLTRWWVSDYIDMTDAQREFLDASTADVLYWHRTTQLARYRAQLLALANTIGEPVDLAELRLLVDEVEDWGKSINARAVPVALEMLLSLSAQQLGEFERELAKSNRDYVKEAKRPHASRIAEDAKDYVSLLKRFTGRLSKAQLRFINEQHARLQPDAQVILDYRRHWQQKMLAALAAEPPDVALLNDLMVNFDAHYTDEFAQMLDANEAVYQELTLGVLNGLAPKQRSRMAEELRDYAQLCSELIADAPKTPPRQPPTLFAVPDYARQP